MNQPGLLRKGLLVGGLFLICQSIAIAQPGTNIQKLKNLSEQYQQKWQLIKTLIIEFANKYNLPIRKELGDGRILELINIENNRPVYYTTTNLGAAKTTRADKLWPGGSLGLSIDGTGYNGLGVWDAGAVRATHQEFNNTGTSRIIQADGATLVSDHSTHVAGTLIGGGVKANARGMNFNGTLRAYDWNNDRAEMAQAAANGLQVSNHSYGFVFGWYQDGSSWGWHGDATVSIKEDYRYGLYTTSSRDWDEIAYYAPNYLIVKSAGNDRGAGPEIGIYPKNGAPNGFDCIGSDAIGKNLLTVGAVNEVADYTGPSSVIMSSFSCWGPADDGRIKPDIVAKGVSTYSSVGNSDAAYAYYDGTSMAAPNVAGTLALLQQHYRNTHAGTIMKSATLKALVINTADEAGSSAGPDYQYGWGLMNAERAAQFITKDATQANVIDEQELINYGKYTLDITSGGTEPIAVTVVWTDPPGTAMGKVLDPATPALVNDLDLKILRNGTNFYPYKLDRNIPSNPATNDSENDVDNVEQVLIPTPDAGVYTIQVDHDGTLSNSQCFSLIIRGAVPVPPEQDDAGIIAVISPSGPTCITNNTPRVILNNFGTHELRSVTVNYQVDNQAMQTYNWSGNLAASRMAEILLPPVNFEEGNHTFKVFTNNPNGVTDQKPSNDQLNTYFNDTSEPCNGEILITTSNGTPDPDSGNNPVVLGTASPTVSASDFIATSGNFALDVFPNPFTDVITLKIAGSGSIGKINVAIINLTGKTLVSETYLNAGQININDLNLPAGTYFIRVILNKTVLTRKLIKSD